MGCNSSANIKTNIIQPDEASHNKSLLSTMATARFIMPSDTHIYTFKEIMDCKVGRIYFMKFLQLEHAEENLIFFEEVENIKNLSSSEVRKNAYDLAQSYLKPGVETEVNISDNMKKNIMVLTNEETSFHQTELLGYLEKAQSEIFMIMAMGAYPRFVKCKLYYDYYTALKSRKIDVRQPEKVKT